jgi:hypothetical protein
VEEAVVASEDGGGEESGGFRRNLYVVRHFSTPILRIEPPLK